jgi:hypothetical protein
MHTLNSSVQTREEALLLFKFKKNFHSADVSLVHHHVHLREDIQKETASRFSKTADTRDELVQTMLMLRVSPLHFSASVFPPSHCFVIVMVSPAQDGNADDPVIRVMR